MFSIGFLRVDFPGTSNWQRDWIPVSHVGVRLSSTDELEEWDFLLEGFTVDVDLRIGNVDFSAQCVPLIDFAGMWVYVPMELLRQRRLGLIPVSMPAATPIGLQYRFALDSYDRVRIRKRGAHPEAEITLRQLMDLSRTIMDEAYGFLLSHRPELVTNPYLRSLARRTAVDIDAIAREASGQS